MFYTNLFFVLCVLNVTYCDWVSDWMAPVQEQLRRAAAKKIMNAEVADMMQATEPSGNVELIPLMMPTLSKMDLKTKLEMTLTEASDLINRLQSSIVTLENQERRLKEAIASGRFGTSAVTVSVLDKAPRQYLVRDGVWSVCRGMLQYDLFTEPRCIGTQKRAQQDPCVFNSMIKYEIIPEKRKSEYVEEDVFCLKPMFNTSLETYHSVPWKIVDVTCREGTVRKLDEQLDQCGMRVLTEYSYYPNKDEAAAQIPLEYCTEKDGSCKLIVAWHITNMTAQNFEFLKNDIAFKKYFLQRTDSERPVLLK